MKKWIKGALVGFTLAGVAENTNAQDMLAYENNQRQQDTAEVLSETTTPLEKYNQLMDKIKNIGKLKIEWKQITNPVALQKLYDIQRPLYKKIKKQLKLMEKEGKDVTLLKEEAKKYTTLGMSIHIKKSHAIQKNKKLTEDIANHNKVQEKLDSDNEKLTEDIANHNKVQEKLDSDNEKEQETIKKENEKQAQLRKINDRLSKRKKDLYNPQSKRELQQIISTYETKKGKGTFFKQDIFDQEDRDSFRKILNK